MNIFLSCQLDEQKYGIKTTIAEQLPTSDQNIF